MKVIKAACALVAHACDMLLVVLSENNHTGSEKYSLFSAQTKFVLGFSGFFHHK
jgi:hypothetical protein